MKPIHDNPWRQGIAAARANAVPGLILIGVAIAIIVGYHAFSPVTAAFDQIAAWKLEAGMIFAIVSTGIFGGLLPTLVQQTRPTTRSAKAWAALPFLVLFWAFKGFEIDLLYRGQAVAFGDNAELATIATKVAVDQFIYNTAWGMPSIVVAYAWHESGYDFRRTWQRLGSGWYRRRVLPMLLAGWAVWIPTVTVIYCMKLPLQLPVQNVILCIWAIMVLFMVRSAEAEADAGEARAEAAAPTT